MIVSLSYIMTVQSLLFCFRLRIGSDFLCLANGLWRLYSGLRVISYYLLCWCLCFFQTSSPPIPIVNRQSDRVKNFFYLKGKIGYINTYIHFKFKLFKMHWLKCLCVKKPSVESWLQLIRDLTVFSFSTKFKPGWVQTHKDALPLRPKCWD